MCPLAYYLNSFEVAHTHGHILYSYALLVPLNQKIVQEAKQGTKCGFAYHNNKLVATHALGHMMYGYSLLVTLN